jgi:hypothetical protein
MKSLGRTKNWLYRHGIGLSYHLILWVCCFSISRDSCSKNQEPHLTDVLSCVKNCWQIRINDQTKEICCLIFRCQWSAVPTWPPPFMTACWWLLIILILHVFWSCCCHLSVAPCVAFGWWFIGPCRVHQRNRSRAHQQQQEVPGSTYPDHERRAWT